MREKHITPISGNPGPVDKTEPNVCSICHDIFTGYGNNAYPVNEGRCCNDCNSMVVIPARIRRLYIKPHTGQKN